MPDHEDSSRSRVFLFMTHVIPKFNVFGLLKFSFATSARFTLLRNRGTHLMSHDTADAQIKSLHTVCQQLGASAPPSSYSRDPHDHLAVGVGGEACFAGPDLTQDVQDGVAAVVVEDSPEPSYALIPPPAAAQGVRIGARATRRRLTARANRLPQVLGLFVVQYFPLLIDSLPALKNPVDRRTLVDDEACGKYGLTSIQTWASVGKFHHLNRI